MELKVVVLLLLSFLSFDLTCSSHTSNRLPYPRPSFPDRQSVPAESQDTDPSFFQGTSNLFSNINDYDYNAEPQRAGKDEKDKQCFISTMYKQSIPTGDIESLPGLEWLTVESAIPEACESACCDLGPAKCQYLWIVNSKCLAVSCPEEKKDECRPSRLSSSSSSTLLSTYFKMGFAGNTAATTTEPGGGDALTQQHSATTSDGNPVTPSPRPFGPTHVTMVTQNPSTRGDKSDDERSPTTVAVGKTTTPPTIVPTEKNRGHDHGITVAIAGTKDITLPEDSTQLFSNTWPEGDMFAYNWELLKGPRRGTLHGRNLKDITLNNLVEGVYQLKVTVTDLNSLDWGEANVNVTVRPANRVNSPPVPVILPSKDVTVHLPQNLILDASSSQDDLGPDGLTFHWEEVTGPVGDSALVVDEPVLVVNDLQPGHYTYRLTVTDEDGAKREAFVNVTVEPEQDYPPTANAGLNQLIRLPKNEVYIYGNKSTDDKGIVSYEWVMSSGPGSVDLEGSSTSTLHVRNLDLGTYVFTLTVTDTAGHSSSDDVTVSVQPEMNEPPLAKAGGNQTVFFPTTSAVIDGSESTDDYRIDSYHWTQLSGPTDVTLSGVNSDKLTVNKLHIVEAIGSPTVYEFMLTVVDYRNLTDNDTVFIFYRKDPQTPPKASAGPSVSITLPQDTVSLDGGESADDFGIESYEWIRSGTSPAAGMVVDGSDHKPVLVLSGLVTGNYTFTLVVTNKYKKKANDTVTLTVLPNPLDPYILQVQIEGDISNFTQAEEQHLGRALSLLLEDQVTDYDIIIERLVPFDTHMMVEFYAVDHVTGSHLNSSVAYKVLTEKGQDFYFSKFHFLKIDMKVCHLPCSGHGFCDQMTRKCRCSTFWMENPFKSHFGKMESNCEWSVFYVALVCLAVVVLIFVACWLCCCCCLRKRRMNRSKRRIRYAILDHNDAEEGVKMLPRDSFHQTTSLMVSESETEEEILFETKKGQNLTPQKNGRAGGQRISNGTRKTHSPKPNS